MGQKLDYNHFKVVWQSSFKYSYLSNHWQEPSHTWNIIALTLYPGCGPEVGIRVQELGYIHFEVLPHSVFLNIHISAINDKSPFILGTLSYQSIDFHFYSILFVLSHSLGKLSGHHRWICNNPFPPCPVFSCPSWAGKVHSCPFFNIFFPPLLLYSFCSLSLHCAL